MFYDMFMFDYIDDMMFVMLVDVVLFDIDDDVVVIVM